MTKSEKLKHCAGCYNNDYNHGLGGSTECWSLKDMKMEKRIRVHINQMPPYKQKAERMPGCYRRQQYVMVKPDALTSDGFWKG